MSCRTTHAGSLATTYAARYYGLQDGMVTSLFHSLKKSFHDENMPNPTRVQYLTTVADMEQNIRNSPLWSEALRARALRRVENVFTSEMPEPALASALIRIGTKASIAARALDNFFERSAARLLVPPAVLEEEFYRIYKKYDRNLVNVDESVFNYSIDNAPQDPATRFAAGVITYSMRCETCGQFIAGQYSTASPHVCPEVGNRPMIENALDPRDMSIEIDDEDEDWDDSYYDDEYNEEPLSSWERDVIRLNSTLNDLSDSNSNAPVFEVVELPAWDMEEFQNEYDEAKIIINNGDYSVPTLVNPLPGEVTGGLGSRVGGNSFGLELEIDFPEDEYPYNAREMFARRLYEEGIVSSPFVQRWHFVGDDRPGGDFHEDPNGWICEFDRSVDDVDGERGVEIKSQILYDEPQTWHNLERICAVAKELGGAPTYRTGLHVNVGGQGFTSDNVNKHNSLLRLASSYDDVMLRIAHNPLSGNTHRGRGYCSHAPIPPEGFRNVAIARARSSHYQAFNLGHLPAEGERMRTSSRIEVRIWDSTLDPGRIQGAVVASLALTKLAEDEANPGQPSEIAGTHRQVFGSSRLEGEQWEKSTESFRRFITLISKASGNIEHHKKVLTRMFASSRWQS